MTIKVQTLLSPLPKHGESITLSCPTVGISNTLQTVLNSTLYECFLWIMPDSAIHPSLRNRQHGIYSPAVFAEELTACGDIWATWVVKSHELLLKEMHLMTSMAYSSHTESNPPFHLCSNTQTTPEASLSLLICILCPQQRDDQKAPLKLSIKNLVF